MQPESVPFVRTAAGFLLAAAFVSPAMAQSASPGVTDQLRTYKLVKLATDSGGLAVVQPGSVLTIQQGGLLGVPPDHLVGCAAKFQNGQMKAAGGFCAAMVKDVSRFFQVGEKVYPVKIDVNVKKEEISFKLVSCDDCNGINPPSFYKADLTFQFPKGYLEGAQAGELQQTIAQVLTPDDAGAQQAQSQPASPARPAAPVAQAPPPPVAPPPPIAPPPPPADQPPATIGLGQTVDQVVGSLGQPVRIANVGAKQIYFYKDLKVTFTNGKVSDVE